MTAAHTAEGKALGRLAALISRAEALLSNKTPAPSEVIGWSHIRDTVGLHEWRTAASALIERVVGRGSEYFLMFSNAMQKIDSLDVEATEKGLGVLMALKEDVEGGLLFDTGLLVAAEVFDDFLEQAEHLLRAGYKDPAAMLTGAVLEATLRKLCGKHGVGFGERDTIDPLNHLLAKAGVYSKLVQKQITAWADIRNNADHGHFHQYTAENVTEIHRWVRDFAGQHLS